MKRTANLVGRITTGLAALLALPVLSAGAADLRVLVDTGTEMPLAAFQDGKVVDGIHKDLGEALAQNMGRRAVFMSLPRKRIALALEHGEADIICMYIEAWLPGSFHWSQPFFPMTEVVVTDTSVPRPQTLKDLYGQRVATVLGYYHPEMEQVLGAGFVRDDGPSSASNLRKMAVGRLHHALTQQSFFDYQQKTGARLSVYPPLVVKTYMGQCAVSPHGQVSVGEVNKAIAQLVKDNGIHHISSRYQ